MVLIQQPLHSILGFVCVAARTGDNKMIFDIRKRKFRIIMRSMFSTLETHYKWYIVHSFDCQEKTEAFIFIAFNPRCFTQEFSRLKLP